MIKLSELAAICEKNHAVCFCCKEREACEKMAEFVDIATPVDIIKMVNEDKEF